MLLFIIFFVFIVEKKYISVIYKSRLSWSGNGFIISYILSGFCYCVCIFVICVYSCLEFVIF